MRKFVLLLCCLAAAWSCKLDGTYYVQNTQDFVTLNEGVLVNDYGAVYHITQVASDKVPVPTNDGQRFFVLFDILNANYDILLKNSVPVPIPTPVPAGETTEMGDPVGIALHNIGPNYLNLGINYYKLKGSSKIHSFSVQYKKETATNEITFLLCHDGGDENPAAVEDESTLEIATQMLSIPIKQGDWTPSGINLSCNILKEKAGGGYEVVPYVYN